MDHRLKNIDKAKMKVVAFLICGVLLSQSAFAEEPSVVILPRKSRSSLFYRAYANLVSAASSDLEPEKYLNGLTNTSKIAEIFLSEHDESNPDYKSVQALKNKIDMTKKLWTQLMKAGCLEEAYRETAAGVVVGTLTATPCKAKMDQALSSLADLESATTQPAQKKQKNDGEAAQKKAGFLAAAIRNGKASTTYTEWFIDKTFEQKSPKCGRSGQLADLCKTFQSYIIPPTTPSSLAAAINAQVRKARAVATEIQKGLRKANRSSNGVSIDKNSVAVPTEAVFRSYFEEIHRLYNIPGFYLVAGAPAVRNKLQQGTTLESLQTAGTANCRLQKSGKPFCQVGPLPPLKEVTASDVRAAIQESQTALHTNEEHLQEWEEKVGKIRVALNNQPAVETVAEAHEQLDASLTEILLNRPTDYGAALLENPQFVDSTCRSIKRAQEHQSHEVWREEVKHVALGVTGLAFMGLAIAAAPPVAVGLTGLSSVFALIETFDYTHELQALEAQYAISQAQFIERAAQGDVPTYGAYAQEQAELEREIFATWASKWMSAADVAISGASTVSAAREVPETVARFGIAQAKAQKTALLEAIKKNPSIGDKIFKGMKTYDPAEVARRLAAVEDKSALVSNTAEASLAAKIFLTGKEGLTTETAIDTLKKTSEIAAKTYERGIGPTWNIGVTSSHAKQLGLVYPDQVIELDEDPSEIHAH